MLRACNCFLLGSLNMRPGPSWQILSHLFSPGTTDSSGHQVGVLTWSACHTCDPFRAVYWGRVWALISAEHHLPLLLQAGVISPPRKSSSYGSREWVHHEVLPPPAGSSQMCPLLARLMVEAPSLLCPSWGLDSAMSLQVMWVGFPELLVFLRSSSKVTSSPWVVWGWEMRHIS